MDLHARAVGAVGRDQTRQERPRHRHDARQYDQAAPLLGDFAHALHGDAEIGQHALGDGGELPARGGHLHAARRAIEQSHAEFRLQSLDRTSERRLGNTQSGGGGDETAILDQRQDCFQLERAEVGKCGALHDERFLRGRA